MAGTRKIAAILVTDVVGYSRLAGADEDRTLSRLRGLRSDLIDPAIDAHHGRIVKRTGDGSLIEFRSVVFITRNGPANSAITHSCFPLGIAGLADSVRANRFQLSKRSVPTFGQIRREGLGILDSLNAVRPLRAVLDIHELIHRQPEHAALDSQGTRGEWVATRSSPSSRPPQGHRRTGGAAAARRSYCWGRQCCATSTLRGPLLPPQIKLDLTRPARAPGRAASSPGVACGVTPPCRGPRGSAPCRSSSGRTPPAPWQADRFRSST